MRQFASLGLYERMSCESSSLLRKARHNRKKAVYPWLRTVYGNPEKTLRQLDTRRDELLDDIPFDPVSISDDMIVEWLTLMAERDTIVREIFLQKRKESFDEATRVVHQVLLHHRRLQPDRPAGSTFPAINAALNEVQDYLLQYGLFSSKQLEKNILPVERELSNVEVQTESLPPEEPQQSKIHIEDTESQTDYTEEPEELTKQYFDISCQAEEIKKTFCDVEVQTDKVLDEVIIDDRSFVLSHSPVLEAKWKPEASSTPLGKNGQASSKTSDVVLKPHKINLSRHFESVGALVLAETDAPTENEKAEVLHVPQKNFIRVQEDSSVNSKLNRSATCPEVLANLDVEVPERPGSVSTNCLSMMSTCSTTSTFGLYQRSLSSQMSQAPNFLPTVDRLNMKMRLKLNNPLISVPQVLPEIVNESLEKSKGINRSHNDSID